ncbi:uncharacterized protein LOC127858672 [Dreissena polymorpha]|uniref:uncharacterized protein LOC127858672 n=1 Tax=Dreissena polymorpha TaxID=45954 RepID=UPI002263DC54|nr:uncharacterized protein LOC127858672 [Dreissena polymorpha]
MELINTEHWNEIIHGVKTLSEFTFSESGIIVEKPNIALKCGQERKLAERLKLGYVKGKGARSKKVPIIFPEETVAAIDMLMQHRESFIMNKTNPYIFARLYKNSLKSLRGSDCVREVCVMAELQHASLVTATQMRKYLATTLQLLDMKETELRWITDHMGHTVDVHKKWYRLSNRAVELTKVASILSATESGHLKKAHHVLFDNVSKDVEKSQIDGPYACTQNVQMTQQIGRISSDGSESSTLQPKEKRLSDEDVGKSQIDGPHACTQNVQMTQQIGRISSGGSESSTLQPKEKRLSDEGKKKQVHVAWRVDEKKALYSAFGQYLNGTRGLPGKGEIFTAQTKFSILQNRSWLNIKYQLKNMLKKNK